MFWQMLVPDLADHRRDGGAHVGGLQLLLEGRVGGEGDVLQHLGHAPDLWLRGQGGEDEEDC